MMPSATSSSPLLSSLHAIYQTYKNGTAVLINWLIACEITDNRSPQLMPTRLPVRQILDLAEKFAKRYIVPPKRIKEAFQVALVNHKRLTDYYEGLDDAISHATAEAPVRHKHFNETLAKAYDSLFAVVAQPRRHGRSLLRRHPSPFLSTSLLNFKTGSTH
jgi:hypothetical protein